MSTAGSREAPGGNLVAGREAPCGGVRHIRGKGGGVFGHKVLGVLCIRPSGRYSLGSATNVPRAVTALNMAASRDPKTSVFGYGSNGIKQLQARVKVSSTAELRCGVVVVAAA